jgi:hypothetical protein
MLLAKILTDYANTSVPEQRSNARLLRRRLMEGEFDASDDEADAWIDSPEGQATFDALIWGKKE